MLIKDNLQIVIWSVNKNRQIKKFNKILGKNMPLPGEIYNQYAPKKYCKSKTTSGDGKKSIICYTDDKVVDFDMRSCKVIKYFTIKNVIFTAISPNYKLLFTSSYQDHWNHEVFFTK